MSYFTLLKDTSGTLRVSESQGIIKASQGLQTTIVLCPANWIEPRRQLNGLKPIGICLQDKTPLMLLDSEEEKYEIQAEAWFDPLARAIYAESRECVRVLREHLDFLSFLPNNEHLTPETVPA